jgi:hypothetical protein
MGFSIARLEADGRRQEGLRNRERNAGECGQLVANSMDSLYKQVKHNKSGNSPWWASFPTLLDNPSPILLAYPRETLSQRSLRLWSNSELPARG